MAELVLIAALSADGFISRARGVPWDLPTDREHFRRCTRDRWLLLGRHTHAEMIGWFRPGHHPLVLSRDTTFTPSPGQRVGSVTEALALADAAGKREVWGCGGAQAYAAAMPQAQRLILTHVACHLGQGLAFPAVHPKEWKRAHVESYAADAAHAFAFEIVTYQRRDHARG